MPRSMLRDVTLAALALGAWAPQGHAQSTANSQLRPTDVVVKISNDPNQTYNGTYQASGISTTCGLADFGYPHRVNSFAILFPDDTNTIAVPSVQFDADTLKSGTTVTSFYLSVNIRVGQTGLPPAYVVRANQPQYNEPGTATRTTTRSGIDSLTLVGTASKGTKVRVEMTVVCQP